MVITAVHTVAATADHMLFVHRHLFLLLTQCLVLSVFILLYVSVGVFGANAQGLIDSGLVYVQTMIGDLANG